MSRYKSNSSRVEPASHPLPEDIQGAIDAVMRGNRTLVLFTTLARDRRLFFKFFNGGLLDRGHLTLRQREIVIGRVTAQCGAEYEWGVHTAAYAAKAGLNQQEIASIVNDGATVDWNEGERILLRLCDELHECCTIDDDLWRGLTAYYTDEAILELLMVAGFYRMVSYLVNSLRLPLEPKSPRFEDFSTTG